MAIELDNIDEEKFRALNNILAKKKLVTRGYNNRVKYRSFNEGDLVWKPILPMV